MGPDPARRSASGSDVEERPIISTRSSSSRAGAPARSGFDRFELRPELLRAIADLGFAEPRPIQVAALPAALEGRDVLGLAQTGTGKTAAFALPIIQRLLFRRSDRPAPGKGTGGPRTHGPRALVVAPTRELAAQVQAEFERLAEYTPVTSISIFGGVPIPRQVSALRNRPDVVVACPGRLLDLMNQGALSLDRVEVLVLDEADHMFDMGFLPDVRRILKALPARRQNLLFSATMPREIRSLADAILNRPKVVELANARPAETIAHMIYPVAEGDKIGALEVLLGGETFRSAIVFLRTKRRAKRLAERLDKQGHAAVALQGNMSQPQRERALQGFRDGRYDVLVATDIAARGLDIAGVSHVVNFDVPNTPDAYTHRIGRTGRAERSGTAFTFVTPDDAVALRAIEKRLGAPIERRRLSELGPIERTALKQGKPLPGSAPRSGSRGGGRNGHARPRAAQAASGSGPGNEGGRARRSFGERRASAGTTVRRASTAAPATRTAPATPAAAFGLGVIDTSREAERQGLRSSERPAGKKRRRRRGA